MLDKNKLNNAFGNMNIIDQVDISFKTIKLTHVNTFLF